MTTRRCAVARSSSVLVALDAAVDGVRERFGTQVVRRGVLVREGEASWLLPGLDEVARRGLARRPS